VKYNKYEFWLSKVPFLGHVISLEGISMDSSKIQDVLDRKPPRTMHQIRSFLKLAGY
jgi:hypothetical protein